MFAELLAFSFEKATAIVTRRLSLAVSLALATILFGAIALHAWGSLDNLYWFESPAMFALSFIIYADAMRAVLIPTYRLTLGRTLGLIALTGVALALALICSLLLLVPAWGLLHLRGVPEALSLIMFYAVLTLVSTRLAFACYALADHTVYAACLRSWELTSRPTFLLTLLVMAAYHILWFISNQAIDALRTHLQPLVWIGMSSGTRFALSLLLGAFISVFFAQWMLQCERLHAAT